MQITASVRLAIATVSELSDGQSLQLTFQALARLLLRPFSAIKVYFYIYMKMLTIKS